VLLAVVGFKLVSPERTPLPGLTLSLVSSSEILSCSDFSSLSITFADLPGAEVGIKDAVFDLLCILLKPSDEFR
jgi:hypothetical protein